MAALAVRDPENKARDWLANTTCTDEVRETVREWLRHVLPQQGERLSQTATPVPGENAGVVVFVPGTDVAVSFRVNLMLPVKWITILSVGSAQELT